MKPKHVKQLQRESKHLRVRRLGKHTLQVSSASQPEATYTVHVEFAPNDVVHTRCTCDWGRMQGVACSHVMAALEFLAEQKGRKLSYWLTDSEAQRQKHRRFYLAGQREDEGIWITSRAG